MDWVEGGKIDRVTPRNSQMRYLPLQNRLSARPLGELSVVDIRVRDTQGVQGEQARPTEVVSTQVVDKRHDTIISAIDQHDTSGTKVRETATGSNGQPNPTDHCARSSQRSSVRSIDGYRAVLAPPAVCYAGCATAYLRVNTFDDQRPEMPMRVQ